MPVELQGIQRGFKKRPARTVHPWQGATITGGDQVFGSALAGTKGWQVPGTKADRRERMRGARRRLGGAAARTVNTGQQLDERTACRLLLMPEGADEGAADRLGGDAECGCGGLLLAA